MLAECMLKYYSLKEQQAHQAVSPPGTADPPWIFHCGLLYQAIWMIACGDLELTAWMRICSQRVACGRMVYRGPQLPCFGKAAWRIHIRVLVSVRLAGGREPES